MQKKKKKKVETERAMGVGRRTTEGIVKWNQLIALIFWTGGRHPQAPFWTIPRVSSKGASLIASKDETERERERGRRREREIVTNHIQISYVSVRSKSPNDK